MSRVYQPPTVTGKQKNDPADRDGKDWNMIENARGKHLVSGVVLLLAVAGVIYWFAGEHPTDVQDMAGSANEAPVQIDAQTAAAVHASAQAPAKQEALLWRAVDEGSVGRLPFFADDWSPEGRVLVRVAGASAAAQAWQVGDRLTIPLPQTGETYRPVIDEIDDGPGYSRAALAKMLDADGHPRRVVVTVGPTSMFAYIDTPEGTFELIAGSEYGWLLPTASMMAGFDFSEPDYILPDDIARDAFVPSGQPDDPGI